jgi:alpha-beta hydrolase superfamily lysophospholipase
LTTIFSPITADALRLGQGRGPRRALPICRDTMMKVFFEDEFFDAQLLRVLSATGNGGADIGECLSTAARIPEGDLDAWFECWSTTAGRVHAEAARSEAAGNAVSARSGFLRASTYFRNAGIALFGTPVDARLVDMQRRQTASFRRAAALFDTPCEPVEIPYEGGALNGYYLRAAADDVLRPTLIATGGYDGTCEELYVYAAAPALRRGWNCLVYDGPGQGAALVERGLAMRPDWENVLRPVIDFTLALPGVDPRRLASLGTSLGGYLAIRGAVGEQRLAATVVDPGQFSLGDAMRARLPALVHDFPDGNRTVQGALDFALGELMRQPTKGWVLRRAFWVHGVSTFEDFARAMDAMTMEGLADRVSCPTLVCAAENDKVASQSRRLFDALQCEKRFVMFENSEGAGEHCEAGARSLFEQRAFDWLAEVLARQAR